MQGGPYSYKPVHGGDAGQTASESSNILIYGVILTFLIGDEMNLFNPIDKNTRAVKTRIYLYCSEATKISCCNLLIRNQVSEGNFHNC